MRFIRRFTVTQQVIAAAVALLLMGGGAVAYWNTHLGELRAAEVQITSNRDDLNMMLVVSMRVQLNGLEKKFGGRHCPDAPPAVRTMCVTLETQIFRRLGKAVKVPTRRGR